MTSRAGTLRYADRYRVLRRLGAGGMATVYLAEDERLGRRVAVKRLHADSPEDVALRFEREARIGASLNHPTLVAVYDTLTDPEGVLIVMEYVDGPTLAHELKHGPLPVPRALAVLGDVATALDHAHHHGVVHRDVKPANVLLSNNGRAKLADLGIALAAERATQITRTGTVLGTPSYMAPEQLEGRDVGPPADIYALGAVAFEALSGRKARTGATPVEIAHRIATEPAPELREAWPEAPEAAAEALCAAMAADPAKRPRSAGELVEWLDAVFSDAGEASEAAKPAGPVGSAGAAAGTGAAGGTAAPPAGAGTEADAPDEEAPDEAAAGGDQAAQAPLAPVASGDQHERAEAHRAAEADRAVESDALPPTAPPSAPSGRVTPGRRRRAWLAPAALITLLALVVAGAALVLGGGGGGGEGNDRADRPADSADSGGGTRQSGGSGDQPATSPEAAPAPGDPASTVRAFYDRAAAGDLQGAWSLAGPGFRQQIGSFESFRSEMSSLESMEFRRAEAVSQSGDSAQVAIETRATHRNRVDNCQGTLTLTRGGPGGWSISGGDIACSRGG